MTARPQSTTPYTIELIGGHNDFVRDIGITSDSRYAISASEDKTIRMWDLVNQTLNADFTVESSMTSCSVGKDNRTIIAGEHSGRIHILFLEGVQ